MDSLLSISSIVTYNPNAIFVSPSSLADIEKCPQLYYYKQVYRSPRGYKIQITNPALAVGKMVHDALDRFLHLDASTRDVNALERCLQEVWEIAGGIKGGFTSTTEEEDCRSRARAMIERFWANDHFHTCVGAKIPDFPKVDLGNDIILTGKLDWVEQDSEGNCEIIDFKTGKNKEKEDSLQLPVYAVLVQSIFKPRHITAKYWYLDTDDGMEEVALPTTDEALAEIKRKAEIVKMVRQTNSYRCASGGESCWACRDILAVAKGQGQLVEIDIGRKQEVYMLAKTEPAAPIVDDLPF
jgi:RecB family exonuclease